MAEEDSFYIKAAEPAHIERLVELRSLLLDVGQGLYVSQSAEEAKIWKDSYRHWLQQYFHSRGSLKNLVVALGCGSAVIGCVTAIIDDRPPSIGCLNGKTGWIQSVVVEPSWRKKGVAFKMLQAQLAWLAAAGVQSVFLSSTISAQDFYKKSGWSDTGEPLLYKRLGE
ncbi:GNAT family N-acetyltransferase [Bartonella massiliensis]|uniref:GNAT family N-acetyltransferase n=1 Tax=Bartonella massiliensis TaxID=929795 RepID=UPI00163D187F|nr:GNAT family N-acetyltransferase [Bartonella massiliensis]